MIIFEQVGPLLFTCAAIGLAMLLIYGVASWLDKRRK